MCVQRTINTPVSETIIVIDSYVHTFSYNFNEKFFFMLLERLFLSRPRLDRIPLSGRKYSTC